MLINKKRINNITNYLSGIPDGGDFKVVVELQQPIGSALTKIGFAGTPIGGATILPSIHGPVTRFNAEG